MLHRDKIILKKILEIIEVSLKIFEGTSIEDFLKNDEREMSMTMSIVRIGELVKNLTMDFRNENLQVQWKPIAGFRDIIAHNYETVDMKEVYSTIKKDCPKLKTQIEKILESEQ